MSYTIQDKPHEGMQMDILLSINFDPRRGIRKYYITSASIKNPGKAGYAIVNVTGCFGGTYHF